MQQLLNLLKLLFCLITRSNGSSYSCFLISSFFNLKKFFFKIKLASQDVILQKTLLGWIVTGEVTDTYDGTRQCKTNSCHIITSLDDQLSKFWEIEEVPVKKRHSEEEQACETSLKIRLDVIEKVDISHVYRSNNRRRISGILIKLL